MNKSVSSSVKSVKSSESLHVELNLAGLTDNAIADIVVDVKRHIEQLISERCVTEDIVEHTENYIKTEKLPRKYYEDRNALYERRRAALALNEKTSSAMLADVERQIADLDTELLAARQTLKNRRDAKMKAAIESHQRKINAIKREFDAHESALNSECNAKQFELLHRQEQLRSIVGKIHRDQRAGGYVS